MTLVKSAWLAAALSLAACTGTTGGSVQDLAVPSDTNIVAPGPTVPPDLAAFSGVWGGLWKGSSYGQPWSVDALMVIERIGSDGNFLGRYVIGDAPGYFSARAFRISGTILNGTLVWSGGGTRYEFVRDEASRLKGAIYRGGVRDLADVTMTRRTEYARRPAMPFVMPDLPLPAGTAIQPHDPGLPPELRAFVGKWGGTWDGILPSLVVVERVDAFGGARGVYIWGDTPDIRAGSSRFRGQVADGVLSWEGNSKFTFTLAPDGSALYGERTFRGRPGGSVEMRKDTAQAARPVSSHWLMGIWTGQVQGYTPPEGPTRTLNVIDVTPDGTVTGAWNVGPGENFHDTKVSLNGDAVSVMTSARSLIVLQRNGDRLAGTFTLQNGRSYPVELRRSFP